MNEIDLSYYHYCIYHLFIVFKTIFDYWGLFLFIFIAGGLIVIPLCFKAYSRIYPDRSLLWQKMTRNIAARFFRHYFILPMSKIWEMILILQIPALLCSIAVASYVLHGIDKYLAKQIEEDVKKEVISLDQESLISLGKISQSLLKKIAPVSIKAKKEDRVKEIRKTLKEVLLQVNKNKNRVNVFQAVYLKDREIFEEIEAAFEKGANPKKLQELQKKLNLRKEDGKYLQALFVKKRGGSTISPQDLDLFSILFRLHEGKIGIRPEIDEFLNNGWLRKDLSKSDGFLKKMEELYCPVPKNQEYNIGTTTYSGSVAIVWRETLHPVFYTLKTRYRVPQTVMIQRQVLFPFLKNKKHQKLLYLLLTLAIKPPLEHNHLPAFYWLGEQDIEKKISTKLYDSIQENLLEAIEKRGSNRYALGVTTLRARSLFRGLIQYTTVIVFFWGMIILLVRGYWKGVWLQFFSYYPITYDPSWALSTVSEKYDVYWSQIWIGRRLIQSGDPITRQIMASQERTNDLIPFLLRKLFKRVEDKEPLSQANQILDEGCVEWEEQQNKQNVLLEFVAWVIPSLGFIGTVVGIGQGLSLASKVISKDPEIQSLNIGKMTAELGTAFDTTLVALLCVVPFTFLYMLYDRLQNYISAKLNEIAKRYAASHIVPSTEKSIFVETKDINQTERRVKIGYYLPLIIAKFFQQTKSRGRHCLVDYPGRSIISMPDQKIGLLVSLLMDMGIISQKKDDEYTYDSTLADYYQNNVMAYSLFPFLFENIKSPHLQELSQILYFFEIRPTPRGRRWYGLPLPRKEDSFWIRSLSKAARVIKFLENYLEKKEQRNKEKLEQFMRSIIHRFARKKLNREDFEKWITDYKVGTLGTHLRQSKAWKRAVIIEGGSSDDLELPEEFSQEFTIIHKDLLNIYLLFSPSMQNNNLTIEVNDKTIDQLDNLNVEEMLYQHLKEFYYQEGDEVYQKIENLNPQNLFQRISNSLKKREENEHRGRFFSLYLDLYEIKNNQGRDREKIKDFIMKIAGIWNFEQKCLIWIKEQMNEIEKLVKCYYLLQKGDILENLVHEVLESNLNQL